MVGFQINIYVKIINRFIYSIMLGQKVNTFNHMFKKKIWSFSIVRNTLKEKHYLNIHNYTFIKLNIVKEVGTISKKKKIGTKYLKIKIN